MEYELVPVGSMSVEDVAAGDRGAGQGCRARPRSRSGAGDARRHRHRRRPAAPGVHAARAVRPLRRPTAGSRSMSTASLVGSTEPLARVADELVESEHLTFRPRGRAPPRLRGDGAPHRRRPLGSTGRPLGRTPLCDPSGPGAVRGGSPPRVSGDDADAARSRSPTKRCSARGIGSAGWLQHDAEAFRLRRDLDTPPDAWDAGGRQPADLWRGGATGPRRRADPQRRPSTSASPGKPSSTPPSRPDKPSSTPSKNPGDARLRIAAAVTVGALLLASVASTFFLRARREVGPSEATSAAQ